jgi:uncharacterized delta-60 repeat protein
MTITECTDGRVRISAHARCRRPETWPILLLLSGAASVASAVDGYFDPTWAGGGAILFSGDPTSSGNTSEVAQIILEGNGQLLIGGQDNNSSTVFTPFVGELQPGGTPVLTFGASNGSGMVSGCYLAAALCYLDSPSFASMALQSDGKISVLNIAQLMRVNTTASALDTAGVAGATGYVTTTNIQINTIQGAFLEAYSILQASSGKLLVAGVGKYSQVAKTSGFAVIRLNSDLSLDTSFNATTDSNNVTFAGGQLVTFNPGTGEVNSGADQVLLQSDGHILLVGHVFLSSDPATGIARLNADGTPDLTYGGGTGQVILTWSGGSLGPPQNSIAAKLDADDRLVLAAPAEPTGTVGGEMCVARVSTGGMLESNFGSGGVSCATSPLCTQGVGANALAFDSAGRIDVAGYCLIAEGSQEFLLERLHGDDGSLDTSFGVGGFSHGAYSATSTIDYTNDIVIDSSGRPVFGGSAFNGFVYTAALGRVTYDLIRTNGFESAPRGCLPPDCAVP